MIKPEDLRIGDVVRVSCYGAFPEGSVCRITQVFPERPHKWKYGTVLLSYADGTDDESCAELCCNIEGVPLTPEILEKNDFKITDGSPICYTESIGASRCLERSISIERKHRDWAAYLKYEDYPDRILVRHIQYVHELQHILWALDLNSQLTYPSKTK